jgi:hypothetical protein
MIRKPGHMRPGLSFIKIGIIVAESVNCARKRGGGKNTVVIKWIKKK